MSGSQTYKPRFGYDIRIKPEAPRKSEAKAKCSVKGCNEPAETRVPKNRVNMEESYWLCREHLRDRNAKWNFFAGMKPEEIEQHRIEAITGHRPTWPLGKRAAKTQNDPETKTGWGFHFVDSFAVMDEGTAPSSAPKRRQLSKLQVEALAVLDLDEGVNLQQVKARYKELVKRFHPDANGGDRGTEERLKQVIKAYGVLRATGFV